MKCWRELVLTLDVVPEYSARLIQCIYPELILLTKDDLAHFTALWTLTTVYKPCSSKGWKSNFVSNNIQICSGAKINKPHGALPIFGLQLPIYGNQKTAFVRILSD